MNKNGLLANTHGASLIEVMLAISVLAIAISGVLLTMITSAKTINDNRDYVTAAMEAKLKLAEIQGSGNLYQILAKYRPGATPDLSTFALPQRDGNGAPIAGQFKLVTYSGGVQVTNIGTITFPGITSLTSPLLETTSYPSLGMPMDLDGNGTIDAGVDKSVLPVAPAPQLQVLPVLIRITWSSSEVEPPQYYELPAILN